MSLRFPRPKEIFCKIDKWISFKHDNSFKLVSRVFLSVVVVYRPYRLTMARLFVHVTRVRFQTGVHMWVEFVVSSRLCSEGFPSGSPVFLPPQKPTLQILIRSHARTLSVTSSKFFLVTWVKKLHLHLHFFFYI